MDISRRTFLAMSAAAGYGLADAGALASAAPGVAPAGAMPICIFSKHLQWLDYGGMAEVAAEAGFDGVDLAVRPGGHVLPERVLDDLPRAVEAVKKVGLGVPMMTTGIVDARDPHTERILKTAAALGIRSYRMGSLNYGKDRGIAASLEAYRPVFRDLAQLNAQHGLHGAYQNHSGTRVGSAVWDIWMLVRELDPRWIGCQYDIRHATVEGGTAWPLGLKLLAPYIRISAIKDFHWSKSAVGKWEIENVPLREGMVDFGAYFELVRELKIAGPISLHLEYPPFEGVKVPRSVAVRRKEEVPLMRRDLQALREMLSAAGLG